MGTLGSITKAEGNRLPRKPKPAQDDPAQSKQFIQTAREVEADGDQDSLIRNLKKIALSSKKPTQPSS